MTETLGTENVSIVLHPESDKDMEAIEKNDVKDKILEAAFGLFCRNGIKSVSMDDIAQHLGVSKKTIYKWFANKDEMVYAATQRYLLGMEENCECIISRTDNAIHELLKIMEMNKDIFSKIHPSIFYDLQKYHPETWQLWQNHKNNFILQKIMENMNKGIAEGLFRKDFDIEVLSRLRLAQIDIAFNPQIFPPEKFDVKKVQLDCLEHFMLGIATLKGHKLINKYKHITEEE